MWRQIKINIMEKKIEEIFQVAKDYLKNNFSLDEAEIRPESNFVLDLGLDSLDLVEFFLALQAKYGVDPEDSEIERAHTIKDACEIFARLIK